MSRRRASALRTLAFGLVAAVGGVSISVVLLEAGLRWFAPQPLGVGYLTDERLALHIPNARVRYTRQEFDHVVTINSMGLRDREYPQTPAPGTFRILVLGDSYTEARQVPLEQAYTELVERRLVERFPSTSWEVLNAGVSGYGTAHELAFFLHYGRALEPHLVVVAFTTSNDLYDNRTAPYFRVEDGEVHEVPLPPLGPVERIVARVKELGASRSHLYQFLRDRYHEMRRELPREPAERLASHREKLFEKTADRAIERDWDVTEALLERLVREIRDAGADVLLVAIPSRFQVEEDTAGEADSPSGPHRRLGRLAGEWNVPYVDLLPVLRAASAEAPAYYRIDGHWNARGHAVAAEAIYRALTRRDLVPTAPAGDER